MINHARRLAILTLALNLLGAGGVAAREGGLIRDAEIEDTIRGYAAPLFAAAGLDPTAVRVHLIQDRSLNAFVAGGQRLFIHTGLLLATERPNQLIGVIAHETGHIAGGHLTRTHEALRNARTKTIIGMVLGAAAAVASGRAEAAGAVLAGAAGSAELGFLKYTRTQESAADAAALRLLDATGQSSTGLLEFLQIIDDREGGAGAGADPYLRSHPLTSARIATIRRHAAGASASNQADRPERIEAHQRMRAKLHGFLDQPKSTLRRYPPTDTGIEGRYARAAAYHRQGDLERALAEIDSLLAERPDDPYFNELKGQILYEHGKVAESIAPYERAVRLQPNSPLLRAGLAQSLIATGEPELNKAAIFHLERAVSTERDLTLGWYQLAIAYGRMGRLGLSALASAERNLHNGNDKDARDQAGRAVKKLAQGTPGWLRAQDIERLAQENLRRQGRR